MDYIPIQDTNVRLSSVALGTWSIGGWMWGGTDNQAAVETVSVAMGRGMAIDTAPIYGGGLSEKLVGEALSGYIQGKGKREDIIIATKFGLEWVDGPNGPEQLSRNSSPARLAQEIKESLQRTGTEYIDLYQVHWPDHSIQIEKVAEAMLKLYEQGTIKAIGVSNFSVEQMDRFHKVAPLHTSQPPYNLFERGIEHSGVLGYCQENNIAVLAYGPLCRGLLTGRMTPETRFGKGDLRSVDPKFQSPIYEQYLAAVARLDEFTRERHGKSVLALAVRWILDQGVVALWGARKPNQLDAVDEVFGWSLTPQDKATIDTILAETIKNPIGPEFMAPNERRS